ncbi:unnamed protein product [Polarella glacialis]|uniref:Uncharacterized protein n=1 Tax=Polarella glacialis TaxID=89957 RepID=A0A813GI02_POLGL|nr:unnamed protein product [Polarella glacialis]
MIVYRRRLLGDASPRKSPKSRGEHNSNNSNNNNNYNNNYHNNNNNNNNNNNSNNNQNCLQPDLATGAVLSSRRTVEEQGPDAVLDQLAYILSLSNSNNSNNNSSNNNNNNKNNNDNNNKNNIQGEDPAAGMRVLWQVWHFVASSQRRLCLRARGALPRLLEAVKVAAAKMRDLGETAQQRKDAAMLHSGILHTLSLDVASAGELLELSLEDLLLLAASSSAATTTATEGEVLRGAPVEEFLRGAEHAGPPPPVAVAGAASPGEHQQQQQQQQQQQAASPGGLLKRKRKAAEVSSPVGLSSSKVSSSFSPKAAAAAAVFWFCLRCLLFDCCCCSCSLLLVVHFLLLSDTLSSVVIYCFLSICFYIFFTPQAIARSTCPFSLFLCTLSSCKVYAQLRCESEEAAILGVLGRGSNLQQQQQ